MLALILIGDPWQVLKYKMLNLFGFYFVFFFLNKIYTKLNIVYLLQLDKNAHPQYYIVKVN